MTRLDDGLYGPEAEAARSQHWNEWDADLGQEKVAFATADFEAWLKAMRRSCDDCEGVGVIHSPAWAEWQRRYDVLQKEWQDAPAFEHKAATFMQSAAYRGLELDMPTDDEESPCPSCGGKGDVLTNMGQAFIGFIRSHL